MDSKSSKVDVIHSEPAAVLIPIKSFQVAKLRLAGVLADDIRQLLAQRMAAQVIRACGALRVLAVCDDQNVARWARASGTEVLIAPGLGLNRAVELGVRVLADKGAEHVVVAHSDLPLAQDLNSVLESRLEQDLTISEPWVTLVPDRRRDGTNVAVVPARSGFKFSYGPGSFSAHVGEAARLGLDVHVLEVPELTFDVDLPSDLAELAPSWTDPDC